MNDEEALMELEAQHAEFDESRKRAWEKYRYNAAEKASARAEEEHLDCEYDDYRWRWPDRLKRAAEKIKRERWAGGRTVGLKPPTYSKGEVGPVLEALLKKGTET